MLRNYYTEQYDRLMNKFNNNVGNLETLVNVANEKQDLDEKFINFLGLSAGKEITFNGKLCTILEDPTIVMSDGSVICKVIFHEQVEDKLVRVLM
jgi:hypothetical protein